MQVIRLKQTIGPDDPENLCDVLAHHSGLSKVRIKRAMQCGAVWLGRSNRKAKRIRRATTRVRPGDIVSLYYDESIVMMQPPTARCIKDFKNYSVWFKPANLMTQGTLFGDHVALTRQVERHFSPRRKVLPVHRLDRETAGLVLLAHNRKSAALLSDMLRSHKIQKRYHAWVLGNVQATGSQSTIDLSLDGKPAETRYTVQRYNREENRSLVRVDLITGRRHQIRRHFDGIGHPVIGDPRYGTGNKNRSGLKLIASGLDFQCPLGHGAINITLDSADGYETE